MGKGTRGGNRLRRQSLISKMASTSTAAPVGSCAKPLLQMSKRPMSLAAMHQHSADMVGSPFVLGLGMSRWEQFLRLRELTPGDIKGRERVLSAAMLGVQRYDLAIRRKCFTNAIQLFQGVRSRQMPRDIVGE